MCLSSADSQKVVDQMEIHKCALCEKDNIEPVSQIQVDLDSENQTFRLNGFRIALRVDLCPECAVTILKRAVVQVQLEAVLGSNRT